MEKKSYAELLKDPRWQKKRLEIMQRDNFTCQHCLATEKSLQVHHLVYEKGKKPWEYENDELITLCEDCHENETEYSNDMYEQFRILLYQFKMSKISLGVLHSMLSYISETLYSYTFDIEKMFCDNEVKKLLELAIYGNGTKADLIIASNKMGIDVTDYVEHVCPELKDRIIKGGK